MYTKCQNRFIIIDFSIFKNSYTWIFFSLKQFQNKYLIDLLSTYLIIIYSYIIIQYSPTSRFIKFKVTMYWHIFLLNRKICIMKRKKLIFIAIDKMICVVTNYPRFSRLTVQFFIHSLNVLKKCSRDELFNQKSKCATFQTVYKKIK
jgi:hypothetical protein